MSKHASSPIHKHPDKFSSATPTSTGLPRYPRFFSELPRSLTKLAGKSTLWGILALLIGANVAFTQREALGQMIRGLNLPRGIPKSFLTVTNILGVSDTQRTDTETATNALKAEYRYWQTVVRDHPDYRDGLFRLAILSYQLGQRQGSRDYIEKVRGLDPNFYGIAMLEELLTKE